MRVGLVLGAGGVVGASWLIGALEALEADTGWECREAEHIVGTSAGAVVGALVADGIPPAYLSAYTGGRSLDALADADQRAQALMARFGDAPDFEDISARLQGDRYRLQPALPPLGPGSWRMALKTLRSPLSHPPGALLAGWLPRGFISTAPIGELMDRFVTSEWPDHANYWAATCDYNDGKRVVFGRDDSPTATVSEAVAASCAIPGFYHPVRIGGRRYVDGGVCSFSNADLLRGRELDLVIVLNPSSSLAAVAGVSPVERVAGLVRGLSRRRLGHEVRKLREEGTQVIVLQPSAEDVAAMGVNFMARSRRVEVMEAAYRSTALALRGLRGTDVALPGRATPPARARAGRSAPARARGARTGRRRAA